MSLIRLLRACGSVRYRGQVPVGYPGSPAADGATEPVDLEAVSGLVRRGSGLGISAVRAVPDASILTMTEVLEAATTIDRATALAGCG